MAVKWPLHQYSRDYSLNCTPLGPITNTNFVENYPLGKKLLFQQNEGSFNIYI